MVLVPTTAATCNRFIHIKRRVSYGENTSIPLQATIGQDNARRDESEEAHQ